MPNIDSYLSLSRSSARSDLLAALDAIISAPPSAITISTRKKLIQALLDDLGALGKGRLASKDAAKGLLAVKSLGRDPSGSEFLALPENLSALLSLSASYKDDADASLESLRCVANALLLVESSRETFLKPLVNGGEFCLNALEKATSPEHIFVLARILFLSTAFSASYIVTFVESKYNGRTVVEIISAKLDSLLISIQTSTKMAKEAMTDVLKFTYNIIHHYPKAVQELPQSQAAVEDEKKVLGDFWSSKLDGLLPPLLRLFTSLPSTFPNLITAPLTHVIHALIGIPVSPSLKNIWFPSTPQNRSSANSPKSSAPQTPQSDNRTDSRSGSPVPQTPPSARSSTLDRALSVLAASRRSLSRSASPQVPINTDVLQRAWDLLEISFNHFFADNTEPDDPKVRDLIKKETSETSLDDILTPLVVLITRLCQADEPSQTRVRQWLVPEDLDRTSPLEQRPDTLGKCLRLLPSVYHPRLKDSIGEMLFAMAGSDASSLTNLVGYGNIAGFLFNKGIMTAPPSSDTDPSGAVGDNIDPITGTTFKPKPDLPEMTDEEKEQEVEKLLWLFDRLEKTGAIPADQNPIRKAIQEGKATLGP
ncbi:Synembryn-B [Leucoagaricus sp. SymC.cos]|nr:Synembryn-B [Leucoagaricus sp. SymC.cos]